MELKWIGDSWENYESWLQEDRKMVKRINKLIKDIRRHPFTGIGKPEPLKHNLEGWWSRRIDETNRLVYTVEEDCLVIAACKTHYE